MAEPFARAECGCWVRVLRRRPVCFGGCPCPAHDNRAGVRVIEGLLAVLATTDSAAAGVFPRWAVRWRLPVTELRN